MLQSMNFVNMLCALYLIFSAKHRLSSAING